MPDPTLPLDPDGLLRLYRGLKTSRLFDETLVTLFRSGQLPELQAYFPAVGQEACDGVPVFFADHADDFFAPSHRDLAAAIMRGVPVRQLAANILARATSQGRGLSNPTFWGDSGRNYLVFSSVIANQYCVGVGAALAFKMRGTPNVALVMLGEGGTSKGALYEAMNFAGLYRLPVLFIVQNNWWAESVPIHLQCAVEDTSLRALGFNMPGLRLNGNDVPAMLEPVRAAVARARAGEGPTYFQFDTYRKYGHSTSDMAEYRDAAEEAFWAAQDPIRYYERWLLTHGVLTDDAIVAISAEFETEILAAIEAAKADPQPGERDYLSAVYCPDGPPPARIQLKFAP